MNSFNVNDTFKYDTGTYTITEVKERDGKKKIKDPRITMSHEPKTYKFKDKVFNYEDIHMKESDLDLNIRRGIFKPI